MTSELLDGSITPPNDAKAEKGVLCSILLRGSVLDDVAPLLAANDFYIDANKRLYTAILAQHDANQPIDPVLLASRLRMSGDFESIGGNAYLGEVIQAEAVSVHAVYYAHIVRKKSILRRLRDAGEEMLRGAYQHEADPEALLDQAENILAGIGTGNQSDEPIPIAQAVMQAMDRIDAIRERGQHIGCFTGIEKIDEEFGGLFPGELNILAARPSMGKTAMALQIADYIARAGKWVYFVSLEMSAAVLATRLLCMHSGVNSQILRKGGDGFTAANQADLVRVSQPYGQATMVIHDRETTITKIRRHARRMNRKHPLSLLVIDYLQLVDAEDSRVARHEQVGKQSKMLKALAVELDIPVLCVCQLNRESTKTGSTFPKLSQLRESGSCEQDCDVGMILREPTAKEREQHHIPEIDDNYTSMDSRVVVLDVQKNRNGAVMNMMLDWTPAFTRFGRRFEDDFTDPTEGKDWKP